MQVIRLAEAAAGPEVSRVHLCQSVGEVGQLDPIRGPGLTEQFEMCTLTVFSLTTKVRAISR
jgi:hypothetical protein